jgi:cyclophilin family peptidyl-prolyl cis-trans isomerase
MKNPVVVMFCGMMALGLFWLNGNVSAEEATKGDAVKTTVIMETSQGNIRIELWPDKAPITVKNFLQYVDEGFYSGTIFHRVIEAFMIQGGGFTPDMKQKPTHPPIKNEAAVDLKNEQGTIAMARTGVVDSATSQFFINVQDNANLNHRDETPRGFGYAVFGKVVEGMDVVDKIKKVPTSTTGMHQNVPSTPVVIQHVKRGE